ncbi:unnamed protein product [Clonostachys rhizophaga]|uniref:Uncharacterized protein n=1 Tax=Clonostachys rhizophaga TaxID=160324 RepID=A0A9N9VKD8_9HYPO|nr:unnamed protein product [Clonostachys rhizophaga]
MVGPAVEIAARVGASCAANDGGSFYVCEGKEVEFIGCCTVDPCKTSNGNCPRESLRNTTYSVTAHDLIPPQLCVSSDANDQWWTCGFVKPPFMGCCGINVCQNEGCPADKLTSAKLNPDFEKSKIFRTEDSNSNKLSKGAIAGIVVGAVVGGILIIALLFFFWKRRQAKKNAEQQAQPRGPGNQQEMSFHNNGQAHIMESPHNKLVSPYTSTYAPSVANTHQDYMYQPSSPSPQMPTTQWGDNGYHHHNQQRGYVPSMVSSNDHGDGWNKPPQPYMAQELPSEDVVVELPEDTAPAPAQQGDRK